MYLLGLKKIISRYFGGVPLVLMCDHLLSMYITPNHHKKVCMQQVIPLDYKELF